MTVLRRVPFNHPHLVGTEIEYIREAVANGHLAGNGPFSGRCERQLETLTGCRRAMMTHSCTAALEMTALLLDVAPGDEVILPSFTFVSTANAFVLRGGVPVFVDIRPDTLNLDEMLVEAAVTPRTRAIMAVHYAGVPCEVEALHQIARRHQLAVVEDTAHALGSSYGGRPAGSLGTLASLSFHETKNIISGEGGALLINDPALIPRAEVLRDKGTNRSEFFRGQVDKYTWVDVGSSFLPGEITCAFLCAQLERAAVINADRMRSWLRYHERLREVEATGRLRRPIVPINCAHNAHMYYILLNSLDERSRLIEGLSNRGITAVFHYVPLHSAPAGRRFGRPHGSFVQTNRAADCLLRLPLWGGMAEQDVDAVCAAIQEILAD